MNKLFISLVLVFFISMSSIRVYVFSKEMKHPIIATQSGHINIEKEMLTESNKLLVPKGSILGVNDTEHIVYSYIVFIKDGIELDFYIDNIEINNKFVSQDVSDLFEFEIEIKELEKSSDPLEFLNGNNDGYYVEILVILSMNSPTVDQYKLIAGQDLSFKIFFESSKILPVNTM